MSQPERTAADPSAGAPARSPLHRVDDAVFTLEQALVALMLVVMTVIVFLDVVYRQLIAPENEISQWLGVLIDDAALRGAVAPWVGGVIGLALLYAAIKAAEKQKGAPILPIKGSAAVLAVLVGALIAGVGVLMVQTSSRVVYLVLLSLGLALFATGQLRARKPGWPLRLGVGALVAGVLIALTIAEQFPRGYTWSKEIAMTVTLWVGFFGASLCVHEGKHIRLEALEKSHPEKAKKWLAGASHLVAALFCLFLAYLGYQYVFSETGAFYIGGNLPLSGVPLWTRTVAIPLLFGISALRFLGAAVSAVLGGKYGAPAKGEGLAEAEKLAAEKAVDNAAGRTTKEQSDVGQAQKPKKPIAFFVVLALVVLLPLLGKGGVLAAVILAGMLLAEPLFVVLGGLTVVAFLLWTQRDELWEFSILIERIVTIADNEALLAIPFFILSGAIMARGQISKRLIDFARALVGWLPGGMAISAVIACMIFAAISGSSPATVVAIGGMMGPALINNGYKPQFAHGLVTSAGSLGILIPPSIPMIVYAIVNTQASIRVEELFAAGIGPGIVIGGILIGYSIVRGVLDKTPRDAFSFATLGHATREGFWSLMFPGLILGGIYSGLFTAVESACISVVYAVVIEVYVHRALTLKDLPHIFGETAIMLGSFLVILVVAMSFVEFLEDQSIPAMAGDWIRSMNFNRLMFLLVLNILLLVVGMLMDIMSAIFVFVPLIAPMAMALGIDPLHLGIVFIVNLEIGYLTPPVGLNLFVASTLFEKPLGYLVRSVAPFIALMFCGLMAITYIEPISAGFGRWIMGAEAPTAPTMIDGGEVGGEVGDVGGSRPPACDPPEDLNCDGNVTMEEMTRFSEMPPPEEAPAFVPRCQPPEDLNCDGNVTMEEMTRYSEILGEQEQ
ncbi:MAG: TRAP transporter large permease subunit [Myxococcota bacterium]|nr:TRAP transporter large permease subunit [Myxococcota bacterium]